MSTEIEFENGYRMVCNENGNVQITCDNLSVGYIVTKAIAPNTIIAIHEDDKKDNHYRIMLWRGMSWQLPEEYKNRHGKIFGAVADNIYESDTVNIELID